MVAHSPYTDPQVNLFYNVMFCDTPDLFGAWNTGSTAVIFAHPLNERGVRAIAEDKNAESRMRALAYNRLREEAKSVPTGRLFGIVIEAALDRGLDVMAAYSDGRIRYINASEKMIVLEQDAPSLRGPRETLLKAGESALGELTPSKQARPGPPPRGEIRLSVIASDGLYVGQAEKNALGEDYLGGPILKASNALLTATIEFVKKNKRT